MVDIDEILNTIGKIRQGKMVALDTKKLADWLEYLTQDYIIDPEEVIASIDGFEDEVKTYLKMRDIVFSNKEVKGDTIEYKFSYYRDESDKEFEELITDGIFRIAEHFNLEAEIRFENYYNGFVRDLVIVLK